MVRPSAPQLTWGHYRVTPGSRLVHHWVATGGINLSVLRRCQGTRRAAPSRRDAPDWSSSGPQHQNHRFQGRLGPVRRQNHRGNQAGEPTTSGHSGLLPRDAEGLEQTL